MNSLLQVRDLERPVNRTPACVNVCEHRSVPCTNYVCAGIERSTSLTPVSLLARFIVLLRSQTLFMTPEFRRVLFSWRYDPVRDGEDKTQCIPFQLQMLFAHMQLTEARSVTTKVCD